MRRISKGAPPPSLLPYVKQRVPPPRYQDYPDKDALRACLLRDQGALCCYCMRRIEADGRRMKIEHLRSQHRHPTLALDWRNLFGACLGGAGAPPTQQTCDARKGDVDIAIDLLALRDDTFRFTETGRIESRDPALQPDLDDTLNLNEPSLVRARRAALDELRRRLAQKHGVVGTWTAEVLGRELDALRSAKPLPELLGLFEYWISRHQRRR